MIVHSGLAITLSVMFSSGFPDGNVAWQLFDGTGTMLSSGTVPVPANAVSVNLPVSSVNNTLSNGALFGTRDIQWMYTIGGAVVNGDQRYSLEVRPPFGVSADGVRAKLGVEAKDLDDSDIALVRAYVGFRDTVGSDTLANVTDQADLLSIRDAIEATAALALIPTMAVRIAVQEDSGTNSYKRQNIDWDSVAQSLASTVYDGILAVNPLYDPTPTADLFILATPATDPFTGDAYA